MFFTQFLILMLPITSKDYDSFLIEQNPQNIEQRLTDINLNFEQIWNQWWESSRRALKNILTLTRQSEDIRVITARKKILKQLTGKIKLHQSINIRTFEQIFDGFSTNQITAILANLAYLQLEDWCVNGCHKCGVNAIPVVETMIDIEAVKKIVQWLKDIWYFESGNLFVPHSASDPLNYDCNGRDISDIITIVNDAWWKVWLTTKVPNWKEYLLGKIAKILGSGVMRVSATNANKHTYEVESIQSNDNIYIEVQWETSLNLPIGWSYDSKSVERSIVSEQGTHITPEWIYGRYPTTVNPLFPNWYWEIHYKKDHTKFLKKKRDVIFYLPLLVTTDKQDNITVKTQISEGMSETTNNYKKQVNDALFDGQIVDIILENGSNKMCCNVSLQDFIIKKSMFQYRSSETILSMISFYLEQIRNYILHNKDKWKILFKTRKNNGGNDFISQLESFWVSDQSIDILKNDSVYQKWLDFQAMIDTILQDPNDKNITEFIKTNPSKFDWSKGKFLSDNSDMGVSIDIPEKVIFEAILKKDKSAISRIWENEKIFKNIWKYHDDLLKCFIGMDILNAFYFWDDFKRDMVGLLIDKDNKQNNTELVNYCIRNWKILLLLEFSSFIDPESTWISRNLLLDTVIQENIFKDRDYIYRGWEIVDSLVDRYNTQENKNLLSYIKKISGGYLMGHIFPFVDENEKEWIIEWLIQNDDPLRLANIIKKNNKTFSNNLILKAKNLIQNYNNEYVNDVLVEWLKLPIDWATLT